MPCKYFSDQGNNKLVGQSRYSRDTIESVHIVNSKNIPQNSIYSWDISQNQDKSVMSWITDDNENGLYEWYIGANYRIKANKSMFMYFAYLINCTKFEGLEYLDLSNTTDIANLFLRDSNITELDLNYWNTENVTEMSSVFSHCTSLQNVALNSWKTENVDSMCEMFYRCENLKKLDLYNFNTTNVVTMQSMFYGCTNLEELNVRSFDTRNVRNMMNMFREVKNLHELDLSNFYTENLTNANAMFFECRGIQTLDISNFTLEDNVDYPNFLENVSKILQVYVKDLDMKNKLLEKFGGYLSEEKIFIK